MTPPSPRTAPPATSWHRHRGTRTVIAPMTISIANAPEPADGRASLARDGAPSTTTDANAAPSSPVPAATRWRASRPQVKELLRRQVVPLRYNGYQLLSSTNLADIRAFCSAGHLRRRPAPVNTSSRRTGSDLGKSSVSDTCPTAHHQAVGQSRLKRRQGRWGQNAAYTLLTICLANVPGPNGEEAECHARFTD